MDPNSKHFYDLGVGPAVRPEDISPTAASVGNPQEVPIDSADPSVKPPPSQGTPQASSGSELQPAVPIIPESPRRLPAEGCCKDIPKFSKPISTLAVQVMDTTDMRMLDVPPTSPDILIVFA